MNTSLKIMVAVVLAVGGLGRANAVKIVEIDSMQLNNSGRRTPKIDVDLVTQRNEVVAKKSLGVGSVTTPANCSSHDAWAFSPITPGNTIRISYSPQAISIKHHGNGCIEISSCVVDCSRGINQVIYSQKKLVENVDTIFVSVGSRMILNNGIKIEGIKIAYSISPDSNQNNDSPFQNVQPIQPLQMQAQPATPPSSPPRTPPQQTSASIFFARNPDTPEFLNVVVTPERGVSQRPRTFNTPKTPECFPLSCERESNISSASLYPENVLPRIYRGPETDAFGPVCDEADLDACLSGRSSQSSSSQWSIHSLGCSDDNMDTDFPS